MRKERGHMYLSPFKYQPGEYVSHNMGVKNMKFILDLQKKNLIDDIDMQLMYILSLLRLTNRSNLENAYLSVFHESFSLKKRLKKLVNLGCIVKIEYISKAIGTEHFVSMPYVYQVSRGFYRYMLKYGFSGHSIDVNAGTYFASLDSRYGTELLAMSQAIAPIMGQMEHMNTNFYMGIYEGRKIYFTKFMYENKYFIVIPVRRFPGFEARFTALAIQNKASVFKIIAVCEDDYHVEELSKKVRKDSIVFTTDSRVYQKQILEVLSSCNYGNGSYVHSFMSLA